MLKAKQSFSMDALTKLDFALAGLVFMAGLALYMRTLAPSLVYSDGAEFQTLAYTLGMTHPTGYPIYLLIGKIFTYIPIENVAYRINLMSAMLGALSLGLLYLIAKLLSGQRVAAFFAPVWLGVNGIFWSQAIMAEVYTTATLFTLCILLFVLLWRQSNHWLYLFAAGLLGGLAIGVHSSVLLLAPPILIYLLLTMRSWKTWVCASVGTLLGCAAAFTVFILLSKIEIPASYYYAGLRFAAPELVLSHPTFGAELNRAFFMLFAKSFKGDVFATSGTVMLESMARYWDYLTDWLPISGLSMMGVGLIAIFAYRWREGILMATALLVSLFFMFTNNSYGLYVFCIPSYLLLALLLSIGVAAFQDALGWLTKHSAVQMTKGLWLIPALLLGMTVWWATPDVISAWRAGHITFINSAERENRYFLQKTIYPVDKPDLPYNEASIVVKTLAPQSIVFSEWNELYTYFYVANVEQNRNDLEIYEVCKFAQAGDEAENQPIIAYIEKNSPERPIYFTKPAFSTCGNLIAALKSRYQFKQIAGGRLWKLIPQDLK